MNIIRKNYKFILSLFLIYIILTIKFPYYIDAPGGIDNISDKIIIDGYKSKGSFNLAYVREYRATIPTFIISFFNKDYKIIKQDDVMLELEDYNAYNTRDKILMDESISNAIYVAYTKANKNIEVISSKATVIYIDSTANTNLTVGDEIISIDDKKINDREDISLVISKYSVGDKIDIKVKNNNKEYNRYAHILDDNDKKIIGIIICNLKEYKTDPKVDVLTKKNESGSSGGLITALSIYNSLINNDLTKGKKIVGTGTIDSEGNIGSIGGVEYKLKSAVKSNADIFLVPKDENYVEAIKLKKEKKYNIEIVGISTFDEAVSYLNNL